MSGDWRSLSRAELDWAYDQRQHAPNMQTVLQALAAAGAQVQARQTTWQRLAYGPHAVEHLDWYRCGVPEAPVLLFIHGGAWRSGQARDYAFFVDWALAAGVDVVIPDFHAVTEVDGDLHVLYRQLQTAWRCVGDHLGPRPRPVHLAGHSSGAHLAACLGVDPLVAHRLHSLTLCSGLYELEPVSLSARSQYVRFTDDTLAALSPLRHLTHLHAPVTVLCGSHESPEFIRQAQALHSALQARRHDTRWVWGEGLNHFEILASLQSPQGVLAQSLQAHWHTAAA